MQKDCINTLCHTKSTDNRLHLLGLALSSEVLTDSLLMSRGTHWGKQPDFAWKPRGPPCWSSTELLQEPLVSLSGAIIVHWNPLLHIHPFKTHWQCCRSFQRLFPEVHDLLGRTAFMEGDKHHAAAVLFRAHDKKFSPWASVHTCRNPLIPKI